MSAEPEIENLAPPARAPRGGDSGAAGDRRSYRISAC